MERATVIGQARFPALVWLQREWWALDLAWTRWWLGFDQSSQSAWLRQLFGEQLRWLGLAIVAAAGLALAVGLGLWHVLRRDGGRDPLARSLLLLKRLGITALPGESFSALCRRAACVHPDRAASLLAMAELQQRLAHAPITRRERRRSQRSWARLRRQLARPR